MVKQVRRTAAKPPAGDRRKAGPRGFKEWALEWAKSIGSAFLLFLIVRTFLIQTYVITSGSMENTLLVGDLLLLSRSAYGAEIPLTDVRLPGYTELQAGHVVVFRGPHQPELDLVKRLVGMPGDTLQMREGILHRNGQRVEEPAATHPDLATQDLTHPWMEWQRRFLAPGTDAASYEPTLHDWGPILVPDGQYFMLGDNRENSLDSRYWGFVPRDLIKGKAVMIYYSYNGNSHRPFRVVREVRWNRIGDRIR